MIGASCSDRHLPEVAEERRRDGAEEFGQRAVHRHGESLDQADQERRDEGAGEGAEPADDDDDEENRPEQRRHRGLRHQRRPGDDARQARERRACAEHEHENARHVVAEHRHHVGMGQRRLDDEADPRPLQCDEKRREHRHRRQEHEHAIGRDRWCRTGERRRNRATAARDNRRAACPRSSARPLR